MFGMDYVGARELIHIYAPFMDGVRSTAIPVETKVMAYVSYLRSGSFQWTLGAMTATSQTSMCRVIEEATNVTLTKMAKNMIHFPRTDDDKIQNNQRFHAMASLPHVVGIIDGTHVGMIVPKEDEPIYVNRKGFHSINCQVITGSDNSFLDFNAKFPGSTHDAFVWSQSSAKRRLDAGEFGNDVLIGDSGYPSTEPKLMIPFENPQTPEQRQYNRRLKTTRSSVERTIGLWKSRFRSMCRTGGLSCYRPEKLCRLIIASATLHNICIKNEIPTLEEDEEHMNNVVIPEMREWD